MAKLNIAGFVECTEVEGPGKRFALWVQGCRRRCPGCCNPGMQDFVPKTIVEASRVGCLVEVSRRENAIEGVTFLGGEPMLQAKGLSGVARFCRERGLSVMVFTGYTLEELEAEELPFADDLLRNTDVLVDGAFDSKRPERERNWVGSTNQRFHYLTGFYGSGIERDARFSHGFELRFRSDGAVQANGFPLESVAEFGQTGYGCRQQQGVQAWPR